MPGSENIQENQNDPKRHSFENVNENNSQEPSLNSTQSPIIHSQLQTKNMEVHAHELHKAPGHGWKHYLFEFLMLFFAVFCGFLAENLREHFVERKQEIQYMHSMVQDLEADTALMTLIISDFSAKLPGLDTTIMELPKLVNGFSAPFARNVFKAAGYEDLIPNDRTIQQLKNSGGMRLIEKYEISNSIMEYDKRMRDLLIEERGIGDFDLRFRNLGELINTELLLKTLEPGVIDQYEKENKNIMASNDRAMLSKYYGWMNAYRDVVKGYIIEVKDVKAYAATVIEMIKREYDFE